MKEKKLNKLNAMNYHCVTGKFAGLHYGSWRFLWEYANFHNVNFKDLCKGLLDRGCYSFAIDGKAYDITAI